MKLANVLRKECVVANVRLADKAESLREVVAVAKKSPLLADVAEKEILAALQSRESLGSTGVGKGVAIPHCRLKSVTEFVVGIITVPQGVDFDAIDGEKVRLIVFIDAASHSDSNGSPVKSSNMSATQIIRPSHRDQGIPGNKLVISDHIKATLPVHGVYIMDIDIKTWWRRSTVNDYKIHSI